MRVKLLKQLNLTYTIHISTITETKWQDHT
jgi:hypothetical protein